ncbi:MAG: hypothetical protein IDH49_12630 [Gammaproteobacteria bacterium]|nr:hypothetical protein [Gammaproteobacteria bacterium]
MMKKVEAPLTPEERWKQRMSLAVIMGYILIGVVVAFVTPENILSHRWAQMFVEFVGGIVPSVAEIMPTSPIHDVAQFYAAMMWVLAPFVTGTFFFLSKNYRVSVYVQQFRERKIYSLFVCLVLAPALIYFLFRVGNISTYSGRAMLSSRMGLAFLYSMALAGVPFFGVLMLLWIRRIPEVYFDKKLDR